MILWSKTFLGCLLAVLLVTTASTAAPERQRGLILVDPPKSVPELDIRDADGQAAPLRARIGHPVLVNLWASWCAPCVAELPALDRVAPKLEALGAQVIALSLDRGGAISAKQTYDRLGIKSLAIQLDHQREAGFAWQAPYLPVTLFINAQGQEIARFNGAVHWDSPQAWPLLEAFAKGEPLTADMAPPLMSSSVP